ncbi:hypothetical protein BTA51_14905 [Hahella sp. CCB-MM4]|uniref:DUF2834 domain-containing protein n=1 Tax=Hahella sp. (strain CCB-MM4) TaxID=1926491 RepID=UPI000B9BA640|nr:DUF2834 domain-containing protein [Hahella sp. CCB-MM4]OZG72418.1 hypothetical protein BTA51_14905 [Hahella sp. CCB-MM4]
MSDRTFRMALIATACLFCVFFSITIIPPLARDWDIFGAFAAGFVNPFAAGYSIDVILCWVVLAIWIIHEKTTRQIRYGWVCLILGIIPGVVVGLATYLILRSAAFQPKTQK